MLKQVSEIFFELGALLVTSAGLAGVLYVVLVAGAGFSLTYGQIFGVFFTVKVLRNWLK